MPRVKRGMSHVKHRRNILKDVKGYKWGRKKLIKLAKTARTLAGAHAYKDRRRKKRTMRGLWQIKINAFVRDHNLSYSRFIDLLKKNNVSLDRKIIADLSVNNKEVLAALIAKLQK